MWLAYACGSAFFAGITAILAKVGIKKIDSNLATAIRTIVVLIFAWIMVRLTGSYTPIGSIGTRTLIYLTLSGIATGASWLCYFRALQLGDVNKVTPIDKSSTILTMILAVIFLNEGLNEPGVAYLCTAVGSICQSDVHPCQGGNRWCEFQSWNGISYWSGTCYGMGGSICNKETETGPEYDLPGWNVSDFIRNSDRSILALLLPGAAAGRSQRSGAD